MPPEEEVLAAKLILEHREPWLRNEATCLQQTKDGKWHDLGFLRYKNPFGDASDGRERCGVHGCHRECRGACDRSPGIVSSLTNGLRMWLHSLPHAEAAREVHPRALPCLSEGIRGVEASRARGCDDALDVDPG